MASILIDDMYQEYVSWCKGHKVPKRAILSPRQYEQQALAFLVPNSEHSEHDACQGDSPSNVERRKERLQND